MNIDSSEIETWIYSPKIGGHPWVKFTNPTRVYYFKGQECVDLMSGKIRASGPELLLEILGDYHLESDYKHPTFFHLTYEWGEWLQGVRSPDHSVVWGFMIEYTSEKRVVLPAYKNKEKSSWELVKSPTFSEYEKKFNTAYDYLLRGESYQINLTDRFIFESLEIKNKKDHYLNFFSQINRLGNFAHATYIGPLDYALVSNTPEALVIVEKKQGHTYLKALPIKGTKNLDSEEGKAIKSAYQFLRDDQKNRGELAMILDLLRHDLSSLGKPWAQIKASSLPMIVSGLLHQYGVIEKRVDVQLTWAEILKAIFPGGSITGAPKKSTMEIIQEIEANPRGFYCGSTLLLSKKFAKATINIRTLDWDKGRARYGAGGGITLLSSCFEEYQEMLAKLNSFWGNQNRI